MFLPREMQEIDSGKVKSIYRILRLHLVVRKIEFYQSLYQTRSQRISNSHICGLCSLTYDLGLVRFILEKGLPQYFTFSIQKISHTCMSVYRACLCEHMHADVCVCLWTSEDEVRCLSLQLSRQSLTEPRAHQLTWLLWPPALGICLSPSHPPQLKVSSRCHDTCLYYYYQWILYVSFCNKLFKRRLQNINKESKRFYCPMTLKILKIEGAY